MAFFTEKADVPRTLRVWFVIHFAADLLFAVPLLLAPRLLGGLLQYPSIDPLTARLVGAALVGIGTESLLGRNATRGSFVTMLRLKVLWSSTATLGIAATIVQGAPVVAWLLLAIFACFCALWSTWLLRLRRLSSAA